MNEQERVQELIDQGYKVQVINTKATKFNEKYHVYKDTSIGKRVVILDENGKITAQQG